MADPSSESSEEEVGSLKVETVNIQVPNLIRPRTSVSAEVYGVHNPIQEVKIPKIPKTPEQIQSIRTKVLSSFIFSGVDERDKEPLIGAFEPRQYKKGETLMTQGEEGDYLCVVDTGTLDVFKSVNNEPQTKVNTMRPGDVVGELALLNFAPRAATVIAAEDSSVWALSRRVFTVIVRNAAQSKYDLHSKFLKNVVLLQNLSPYQLMQLCDALKPVQFQKDSDVVTQGDIGNNFYIIKSGKAVAIVDGSPFMPYATGDYFGELALLENKPRQATVKVTSDQLECLSLDRKDFERLLGPLKDVMKQRAEHTYHPSLKQKKE